MADLPKKGDKVLWRPNKKSSWQDDWFVDNISVKGKTCNVRLVYHSTAAVINLNPFTEDIYFIPPNEELPALLSRLNQHGHTLIVRRLTDIKMPRYQILCTKCFSLYGVIEIKASKCELFYMDGKFFKEEPQEHKIPDLVTGVVCPCSFPEAIDLPRIEEYR